MTDHPISYSAKTHRQDPESWAERAEAKAVAAAMAEVFRIYEGWRIVSGPALPLLMSDAHDTGPAAENIARAFEGRLK